MIDLFEYFRNLTPSSITESQAQEARKLPEHFDWRDVNGINYIPPVRDQGRFEMS